MAVRPLAALLVPALVLAASENSPIAHSTVHGAAAALGTAAVLLLVAAVMPVAQTIAGVVLTPAKLEISVPPSVDGVRHSTVVDAPDVTVKRVRAPSSPTHQASEEELMASEERLLRALGYDEETMTGDDNDAEGGGLTEDEIASFRRRSTSSDSPPLRFKDRVAEPLSEIVMRWQTQHQTDGCASPKSGSESEYSPCAKGANTRPKHPSKAGDSPRRGREKLHKSRDLHSTCGSPLAVSASA